MKNQITCWLGLIGAILFIVTSMIGGLQFEGYSFVSQYISESYANGVSNTANLKRGFILSGVLLASFGFMAPFVFNGSKSITVNFFLFAIFYGLLTIVTSLYPCDFGCPSGAEVSASQMIHNFSGFLTYVITPLCLIGLGLSFNKQSNVAKLKKVSLACGSLALIFVLLLFKNPEGAFLGLFQRIIEGSILIWVMYTAITIKKLPS